MMYSVVTDHKDEEDDGKMIRWDSKSFRTKFKGSCLISSLDVKDDDSDVLL
jgi:hypothetical protein